MEWISVKDRLPNNGDFVDCWIPEAECRQLDLRFRDGNFEFFIMDYEGDYSHSEIAKNVTHWMPLPQPPKE